MRYKAKLRSRVELVTAMLLVLSASACLRVKVDPVKIDATFTIRMEKELDDFFNTLDASSRTLAVDTKKTTDSTDKDKP